MTFPSDETVEKFFAASILIFIGLIALAVCFGVEVARHPAFRLLFNE
jgi:hypothetical protein